MYSFLNFWEDFWFSVFLLLSLGVNEKEEADPLFESLVSYAPISAAYFEIISSWLFILFPPQNIVKKFEQALEHDEFFLISFSRMDGLHSEDIYDCVPFGI